MSDFTINQALEEVLNAVHELATQDARQPGEFTAREYAERFKLNIDTANGQLVALIKKGRLTARSAKIDGKQRNLYKMVGS